MFSYSIGDIEAEVRRSDERFAPFLRIRRRMTEALGTRNYMDSGAGTSTGKGDEWRKAQPSNYAWAFKQFVKPQLCFGVPVPHVQARHPVEHGDEAEGYEAAMAAWVVECEFKRIFSQVVDAMFVGYGITKVGISEVGDSRGGGLAFVEGDSQFVPSKVFCNIVEAKDFILDADCQADIFRARMIGNKRDCDLDDVRNNPLFDPRQSNKVQSTSRLSSNEYDAYSVTNRNSTREGVTLYEIYFPEYGKIKTYAGGGGGLIELLSEDYWGPGEGPYTLWGLDTVPGMVIPFCPIQAVWDRLETIQEHGRAAVAGARSHKKVVAHSVGAKADAEKVQNARTGAIVGVKDVNSLKDLELGGASEKLLSWIQFNEVRLDQILGFGTSQRGQAGGETATAESIAASNSDLRCSYMQDHVADALTAVYRKVAWYLHYDDSIPDMAVTVTAKPQIADLRTGQMVPNPRAGKPEDATFRPGPFKGGYFQGRWYPPKQDMNFDELEFIISPSSLTKENDVIRAQQVEKRVEFLAMAEPRLREQGKEVDWVKVVDDFGTISGQREYAQSILKDVPQQEGPPPPDSSQNVAIAFRDLSPAARVQVLAKIGIKADPREIMAYEAVQHQMEKDARQPTGGDRPDDPGSSRRPSPSPARPTGSGGPNRLKALLAKMPPEKRRAVLARLVQARARRRKAGMGGRGPMSGPIPGRVGAVIPSIPKLGSSQPQGQAPRRFGRSAPLAAKLAALHRVG